MSGIDPQDIQWRIGSTFEKGDELYGILLGYIDSRTAMAELDKLDGSWSDEYALVHLDGDNGVQCALTVNGITRVDVGVPSNTEGLKGAYSDALKRAAVKHGIGRELYDLPTIAVSCDWYVGRDGKKHAKKPKALPSWNGKRWTLDRQHGWVKYDREPNDKPDREEAAVPSGGAAQRGSTTAAPGSAPLSREDEAARERMLAAWKASGLDFSVVERMAREVGIPEGQKGTAEQYDLMASMLGNDSAAASVAAEEEAERKGTPVEPEAAGDDSPPVVESAASDPLQERIERAKARAAGGRKPVNPEPEQLKVTA